MPKRKQQRPARQPVKKEGRKAGFWRWLSNIATLAKLIDVAAAHWPF